MHTIELAKRIRIQVLRMVHKANASHVGGCLSMADLLASLYGGILRVAPDSLDDNRRDRFILSKGHGAAALYATLAECGFFPKAWLETYCEDDTKLAGHVSHAVPGVDFSTGSLGHGLSLGCGIAVAAKSAGSPTRAFVLLSDGECDEGSIWEAALFAPHHQLDNLVALVDYNKIQSFGRVESVLDLHPFADKWRAFGWGVREIDGHNHAEIQTALQDLPAETNRPTVIIAHTTKGKGVSFMEDQLLWHYKSPNQEQLLEAIQELEDAA